MDLVLEKKRLTGINIKHHTPEIQEYYNSSVSESEKDNRSYAIKIYEIGACAFDDLPMIEALVGRVTGEFKRVGKEAYSEVEIPYANVLEAVFAYLVDNYDYFYVRTRLAYEDGIDKYELHRRKQHYTSDSVFWLLKGDHDNVHKPYYSVEYRNVSERYLVWETFTNKEKLRKIYGLTRKQLEEALKTGLFRHEGIDVQLKTVESSIEASFEIHLKSAENLLDAQVIRFNQSEKLEEKAVLSSSIENTLLLVIDYKKLIEEDRAYSEKVKHLKGKSATELWNKKASELRELYNLNNKK